MKRKIVFIAFFGAHYRYEIFKKIDDNFDASFYLGDVDVNNPDIKPFDYSKLKKCATMECRAIKAPFFYMKGISKALAEDADDYIVFISPYALNIWPFIFKAKRLGKKIHLWTIGYTGRESFPVRCAKHLFFRLADKIMVYANHSKRIMLEKGIDESKISVVYNSYAYEEQLRLRGGLEAGPIFREHFGNCNPNLIFVGRLNPIKKLDMILKAMRILADSGVKTNLTLVGDGREKGALGELANKLGLAENVWFFGACYDQKKMSNMLYNADICVSPGNVGLTSMLAMAYGCPVITHGDANFQDPEFESVKPGKTGDLFRKGDVESLASKIGQWLASGRDKAEVAKNCFAEIDENWNPSNQLKNIEKSLGSR